jgi:uncharacterized protein CbrC (UPF0167 family)
MTDLERKNEPIVITLDNTDEEVAADQEVGKINEGALHPFQPAFQDDNVAIPERINEEIQRKNKQNVTTLDNTDEEVEADQEVWKINEGALHPFQPAFQDDNVAIPERINEEIQRGRCKIMSHLKQLKPNGYKCYKEDPK